jgi:hypothetical protein
MSGNQYLNIYSSEWDIFIFHFLYAESWTRDALVGSSRKPSGRTLTGWHMANYATVTDSNVSRSERKRKPGNIKPEINKQTWMLRGRTWRGKRPGSAGIGFDRKLHITREVTGCKKNRTWRLTANRLLIKYDRKLNRPGFSTEVTWQEDDTKPIL